MPPTGSASDLASAVPMFLSSAQCSDGLSDAAGLLPGPGRQLLVGVGGTLVMPPLAALFIAALGWREAYFVLGCLAALVGVGSALLVENDPRDRGLAPDGGLLQSDAPRVPPTGSSVREAIMSRRFIGLYAACLICSFGLFVPFVHLVPYALDHGVPQSWAVVLLGLIGVGSTAGRFFLGGLADQVGRARGR